MNPVLCLASASPRRRELLAQIGVPHTLASADIDETPHRDETPRDYVLRMAREKAHAVWNRHSHEGGDSPDTAVSVSGPRHLSNEGRLPVLAADTIVVLDGSIYGKPRDRQHALDMLARLSGRTHEVLTAVALAHGGNIELRLSESSVRFRTIDAVEGAAYWETSEPRDKAGGYAIQGLGAVFIESVTGSYSGVMGLPLFETAQLLRSAGLPCWCRIER